MALECPKCSVPLWWKPHLKKPFPCPSCHTILVVDGSFLPFAIIWSLLELPLFGLDHLYHGFGAGIRICVSLGIGLFLMYFMFDAKEAGPATQFTESLKSNTPTKSDADFSKDDRRLKTIESPDGKERVLIVQRPDGSFSYRQQWLSGIKTTDPDSPIVTEKTGKEGEWDPPGPYCGIYDSTETAEDEASSRVPWLKAKSIH